MHLVLRSSKAKGLWSFTRKENKEKIHKIVYKNAAKNFIKIISYANVGNHMHLHLKLSARKEYFAFIRAITGAIALTVMKSSKNRKFVHGYKDRFWDQRPFSVIINTYRHFMNMKDYMEINRLEGGGLNRASADLLIAQRKDGVALEWPEDDSG